MLAIRRDIHTTRFLCIVPDLAKLDLYPFATSSLQLDSLSADASQNIPAVYVYRLPQAALGTLFARHVLDYFL
jgi:hypothetical protein